MIRLYTFCPWCFEVTVPNRTPVALDSIPAREIMVDHADTVDVSRFFSDPDGDPLIWAAAASDGELVAATCRTAPSR